MKMKSQRRIERDRAKRNARTRVKDEKPPEPDANTEDEPDPRMARTLLGWDE